MLLDHKKVLMDWKDVAFKSVSCSVYDYIRKARNRNLVHTGSKRPLEESLWLPLPLPLPAPAVKLKGDLLTSSETWNWYVILDEAIQEAANTSRRNQVDYYRPT